MFRHMFDEESLDVETDCTLLDSGTVINKTKSAGTNTYNSMRYEKIETDSACCNTHNKMNYEKFRVESFKNWPIPWLDVRLMAANGFYFLGFSDAVECAFCKIRINKWEAEDTPESEHYKWAPYCPFLKGENVGNVTYKKVTHC